MSRLSTSRIFRMAMGGAVGGMLAYLMLEPSISAREMAVESGDILRVASDTLSHITLVGAVVGAVIGLGIVLADELQTPNARRLFSRAFISLAAGALSGGGGALLAQIVFGTLMSAVTIGAMITGSPNKLFLVIARTLGWAIMGAGAGLCPGVVSRSRKQIMQGILGGIIGGGIGGVLFDGIGAITGTGSASRMIGFVAMGLAIGALVSLVQELAKEVWLTMLTGTREGRSFILAKDQTTLGRDELTDIPLFGDLSVQKSHAAIVKTGADVHILAAPGAAMAVNSQPVSKSPLSDGDIIQIGKHRMRFSSRQRSFAASTYVAPQQTPTPQPSPYMAAYQSTSTVATGIQVIAGPHAGESYPLHQPSMTVGRDPSCGVPLVRDGMASRVHARFTWDGTNWRVEDAGSTNGSYVNRVRVSTQTIQPGDELCFGQSVFRVV